jgi:hypothetical protein
LSINDKLKSFFISLERVIKPKSPLNSAKYDPRQALTDLQTHLDGLYKSGAYQGSNSLSSEDYIVQSDPYTNAAKIQFEENARCEPMTRAALQKKNDFLFGKGIHTVLDTMYDDFVTTELKSEAVSKIMSKQEYIKAKKVVDKVLKRCNARYWFKTATHNAKTYGRSALLKEYIDSPDEHPTSLCLLYSQLLGNVYNDKKNPGKISYIEYNTNQNSDYNNKIFYEPDDLVYFTNFDVGLTANSLGFGLSEIESIKDIGETNRVINEEDNKEFARSLWAGNVIFKLPNLHNATEVETLLTNYDPGKPVAITSDITAEPIERPHDLQAVTELNIQNDRRELRAVQMPQPLFFEDVTNRATVKFILQAYKETSVEQERIWLKDIIEPQFIYPIWAKELAYDEATMADLDAKLTLEFEEYNFDSFPEKVEAWLPIVQAGYISIERFLEKIGYPELSEEYKKNKQELLKQRLETSPQTGFGNPMFQKGFGSNKTNIKNDPTEKLGKQSDKQQAGDLADTQNE